MDKIIKEILNDILGHSNEFYFFNTAIVFMFQHVTSIMVKVILYNHEIFKKILKSLYDFAV